MKSICWIDCCSDGVVFFCGGLFQNGNSPGACWREEIACISLMSLGVTSSHRLCFAADFADRASLDPQDATVFGRKYLKGVRSVGVRNCPSEHYSDWLISVLYSISSSSLARPAARSMSRMQTLETGRCVLALRSASSSSFRCGLSMSSRS